MTAAVEVLFRDRNGIATWEYRGKQWLRLASGSPALDDGHGWTAPQQYRTITTGDLDGDGRAPELIGRSTAGLEWYRWNTTARVWAQMPNPPDQDDTPTDTDVRWHGAGWDDDPSGYDTIQTGDIDRDGRDEIIGRGEDGVQILDLPAGSNQWLQYPTTAAFETQLHGFLYPDFGTGDTDLPPEDWTNPAYFSTLQVVRTHAADPLHGLVLARRLHGLEFTRIGNYEDRANPVSPHLGRVRNFDWTVNTTSNTVGTTAPGQTLVQLPALSDRCGFDQPRYYDTIRVGDIDGDGTSEVVARDFGGLRTWKLEAGTAAGDARVREPDRRLPRLRHRRQRPRRCSTSKRRCSRPRSTSGPAPTASTSTRRDSCGRPTTRRMPARSPTS